MTTIVLFLVNPYINGLHLFLDNQYIWCVTLWKFENNKNATQTAMKIFCVYDQGDITDCQIQNWFSKSCFVDTSLTNEPDQDNHKTSIKML